MKNIFLLSLLLVMGCTSFAQKQTFNVVSFAFPKGWQQQKSEAGIQLSITDKKTGDYGITVITKARVSSVSAPIKAEVNGGARKITMHPYGEVD